MAELGNSFGSIPPTASEEAAQNAAVAAQGEVLNSAFPSSAAAGASVRILQEGRLSGFNGLVAGQGYQPSATAGTIERLENHRAALPSPVARAVSTTELEVLPQQWGVMGKSFTYTDAATKLFVYATEAMATGPVRTAANTTPGGSAGPNIGYAYGGATTAVIDGITFSTELFSVIGNLTTARYGAACFSSATKGYACAGTLTNIIDAIVFATGGDAVDIGDTSFSGRRAGAVCSNTNGYTLGATGAAYYDVINRFTFAVEGDASALSSVLSGVRGGCGGINSSLSGYACGGSLSGGTVSNIIDKLTFSTEILSVTSAVLAISRDYVPGASSVVCGTMCGGYVGLSQTVHDRLVFATEVCAITTPANSAIGLAASSAS